MAIAFKSKMRGKRAGVAAESFDPEKAAADDFEPPKYPKTDEQQERLHKAIGSLLIFRSLEKNQLYDVILVRPYRLFAFVDC